MANDRVEQQLERLKQLKARGASVAAIGELRTSLSDKINVVVAKAAAIAEEWQAQELIPDLIKAFDRLFIKPVEKDQQCWGKNALSSALKNLNFNESALFLRGLQHCQWEPVWGGRTDTAVVLRGTCALGLVQCRDLPRHETLQYLVNAATEEAAQVRTDAIRALEQMGGPEVTLLLRLKARASDSEPRVTGQVLESLLHLEGVKAVEFVATFLHHLNAEVSEEAALALSASRIKEAIAVLKPACLQAKDRNFISVLLRALSISRDDDALQFLIGQVSNAPTLIAEEALRALKFHRESSEITNRIAQAVSERPELVEFFSSQFEVR